MHRMLGVLTLLLGSVGAEVACGDCNGCKSRSACDAPCGETKTACGTRMVSTAFSGRCAPGKGAGTLNRRRGAAAGAMVQ